MLSRTKNANGMIRRYRGVQRQPAGDAYDLANAIINTVNSYLHNHRDSGADLVSDALDVVLEKVEEVSA